MQMMLKFKSFLLVAMQTNSLLRWLLFQTLNAQKFFQLNESQSEALLSLLLCLPNQTSDLKKQTWGAVSIFITSSVIFGVMFNSNVCFDMMIRNIAKVKMFWSHAELEVVTYAPKLGLTHGHLTSPASPKLSW